MPALDEPRPDDLGDQLAALVRSGHARRGIPSSARASAGVIGGRCASRAKLAARATSWALLSTGWPCGVGDGVLHADPQVAAGRERREQHRQRGAADAGGRERGALGQVAQRRACRRPAPRRCPACRRARPSRSRRARGRRPAGRACRAGARSAARWPRSKISYSGTMPRSCMRVCSSTMNSQRFRNTSSPKLTVPIVQEAMSGPASSTAQAVLLRIGDRAAGGQLHDQAGRLAQRRRRSSRSRPRSSVGLRLVVADVDVDHAGADRLALLGGDDQLVERHRQRRRVALG